MKAKRNLMMILALTLLMGGLQAQQKKVIKIKQGDGEEKDGVVFIHDGDGQKVKIKKEVFWVEGDSLDIDSDGDHVILLQGGDDEDTEIDVQVFMKENFKTGDSLKQVIMLKSDAPPMPHLNRVVILKSGLFRRDTTVILHVPGTRKIVKVIDDGKEVPAAKFHKYRKHLDGALDMAELEELAPRIEEMEIRLALPEISDSLKLESLDSLLVELKVLQSDLATLQHEKLITARRVISMDAMANEMLVALEKAGLNPPEKIKSLRIEDDRIWINGEELTGKAADVCLKVFQNSSGDRLGKGLIFDIEFD